MELKTVIYEKKGGIAYITLNRPERMNAFNSVMSEELPQVWQDFEEDDALQVAVVTGAGERAFCAGADVREMAEGTPRRPRRRPVTLPGEFFRISPMQNNVWKPTIAAVNGLVAGGGLHFLADCDIVICSENATFTDPHVTNGLVSGVETVGLTRRIPFGWVMRLVLMGKYERINARTAYEIGLVSEIVPPERLVSKATEIAQAIMKNSPLAVRATKMAQWKGLDLGLKQAIELAWYFVQTGNATEDSTEGRKAFAEKREPRWTGR